MKKLFFPLLAAMALSSPCVHAANVLLINFSSAAGNDMDATAAAALGADAHVNVRTGSTNAAGTTATIGLDGVTGSVIYADYYQAGQLANLGQPFATLLGPNPIGSTGLSVDITLSLGTWMENNDFTAYSITVYYAGRSENSETLMTDGDPDVHFTGGISDTVTVTGHGNPANPTFWSGIGQTHTFSATTLDIDMDYLGGTSAAFQAGIAAIKIEGIPEPATALMGAFGALALLRRRR